MFEGVSEMALWCRCYRTRRPARCRGLLLGATSVGGAQSPPSLWVVSTGDHSTNRQGTVCRFSLLRFFLTLGAKSREAEEARREREAVQIGRGDAPELTAAFDFFLSVAIAEKALVADTVEAVG
jgi:hypothetical protein